MKNNIKIKKWTVYLDKYTNGSVFIYKKRFCRNKKFHFPDKIYALMLRKEKLYFEEIYKFSVKYFFIWVIVFVY